MRDSVDVYHYVDSSNNAKIHVLIKKFAPDKFLETFERRYRIILCLVYLYDLVPDLPNILYSTTTLYRIMESVIMMFIFCKPANQNENSCYD